MICNRKEKGRSRAENTGCKMERKIMMKSVVKTNAFKAALLLLVLVSIGCAAHTVVSHWRMSGLTINGSEDEWPAAPQYYDADRQAGIRMMNDAEAIYLCFSTSNEALKKKLLMTGLTVWLDPAGDKNKTFGIHLPGAGPRGFPRKSGSDGRLEDKKEQGYGGGDESGNLPADDRLGDKKERPVFKTPDSVEITYAEATGPLSMPMDQVRQTGIEIGVGQPDGRRFVYEFKICFRAGPSLSALAPGKTVGIGIEAVETDMHQGMRKPTEDGMGRSNHGGGRPGGGGSGGGGSGGGGSGAKAMGEAFETWIKVTLVGGSINANVRG